MPRNKLSSPNHKQIQYSWKTIYEIAFEHKKELFNAHWIAILATIASVPVPLFMPLLVDEVLLNKPGNLTTIINYLIPSQWQQPAVYIAAVLIFSLLLRLISICFNIIQSRQFTIISKDIIFRIRKDLINRLQSISM